MDMYYVKRAAVWLYRWKHCRGFGVQSPTDYRFVRYVINEHAPFYAYHDLQVQYPHLKHEDRRFARLLLRIANYRQPASCLLLGMPASPYQAYIQAGCRHTVVNEGVGEVTDADAADLVCCQLSGTQLPDVETLLSLTRDASILVLRGIRHDSHTRQMWSALLGHPSIKITYDLYGSGIIIFDKKRYKHNYIINF